ncbi:hypothetical protein [Bacillus sp. 165]|uniref:hypothetical protein n=1 Tax=Bacillus sp. 165 TaxID=1529117 RepID=UPI001AD993A4|nr:hypothetical protein [Bacillus sp. 165]MBO9128287.1 hypothetical protein [Bacillus sp. 165]
MHLPSHGANPLQLYNSLGETLPPMNMDYSVNTNPVMSVDMNNGISEGNYRRRAVKLRIENDYILQHLQNWVVTC